MSYFEDLEVGASVESAPSLTLSSGLAALHQAILGDRLRLGLDAELATSVAGQPLVHPGVVWDVSIGQSTVVTERVIANLFYRGLVLRRLPAVGDTLRTKVEVIGLRRSAPRPDRPPRGLALLRIRTDDQLGRPVLDFERCAMLPCREEADAGADADPAFEAERPAPGAGELSAGFADWRLERFRATVQGPHFEEVARGGGPWQVSGGDVVSSAPDLARLTLNLASVHHDPASVGREERLVYGGHVIGLAASHLVRALPGLVTIVGWRRCDHLAPVFEGDLLRTRVDLERAEALPGGGGLLYLRARVKAGRLDGGVDDVLDWRLIGLMT